MSFNIEYDKGVKMIQTIILNVGSGKETQNDPTIIKQIIDEIYLLQHQSRKKIIIKFDLFEHLNHLTPLKQELYTFAYFYAQTLGLLVTASFYDFNSLHFLETFRPTPFLKLSCRNYLYNFIDYISKDTTIIVDVDSTEKRDLLKQKYPNRKLIFLYCLLEYPAEEDKYRALFYSNLSAGISDNTDNLNLYKRYHPLYYERHFILEHGITDYIYGDSFCSTAKEIKEII